MHPKGVPDAVKNIRDQVVTVQSYARQIAERLPLGGAIAKRLLTDDRMKNVWPELLRANVASESVPATWPLGAVSQQVANLNSFERLETWDIPAEKIEDDDTDRDVARRNVALAERRCAAFFAYAVIELSCQRTIRTQKQVDELTEHFRNAPAICRSVGADAAADLIEKLTPHLGGSPYTVKKPSGKRGHDDEVRARTRALANAMRRIFGSFNYGTVATVAKVALDVNGIGEQDVRNWCKGLPR